MISCLIDNKSLRIQREDVLPLKESVGVSGALISSHCYATQRQEHRLDISYTTPDLATKQLATHGSLMLTLGRANCQLPSPIL